MLDEICAAACCSRAIERRYLPVPARMLSPPVPLHQNYRRHHDNRGSHKAKRIQRKSAPMKQKNVADGDGDGRQNHDEE